VGGKGKERTSANSLIPQQGKRGEEESCPISLRRGRGKKGAASDPELSFAESEKKRKYYRERKRGGGGEIISLHSPGGGKRGGRTLSLNHNNYIIENRYRGKGNLQTSSRKRKSPSIISFIETTFEKKRGGGSLSSLSPLFLQPFKG